MGDKLLRVGDVAKASGVSADTVRHYERVGLLPKAMRSRAGYRLYPRGAIVRVTLVRRGVQFGFSLRELSGFLNARDTGTPPCRQVRAAGERILERVGERIAELQRARDSIRRTLRSWDRRLAATPSDLPARLLESLPHRDARPAERPPLNGSMGRRSRSQD